MLWHLPRRDLMDNPSAPIRCNICGYDGSFIRKENERESMICKNCSSSSRLRAVMYILGTCLGISRLPVVAWAKDKEIRILESSGRGPYPMMLKEKFDYYNTEYDPASELMKRPFTAYADFQSLAYDEGVFDYVIASDVFEHVREDAKGFSEIFRVLKKGGAFILTVPYNHEWEQTLTRVKVEGDKDIELLPPEYHGGGGQTLAYRTYGRDLPDRLRSFGFSVALLNFDAPQLAITRQVAFVAIKEGYLDVTKYHFFETDARMEPHRASPLFLFRLFSFLKYNSLSVPHFISEVRRRVSDRFPKS